MLRPTPPFLALLAWALLGCASTPDAPRTPRPRTAQPTGKRTSLPEHMKQPQEQSKEIPWTIYAADTPGALLGCLRNLRERTEIRLPAGHFILDGPAAAQAPSSAPPLALRLSGQGVEETVLEIRGHAPLLRLGAPRPGSPAQPIEIEFRDLRILCAGAPLITSRESGGRVRILDANLEMGAGMPIVPSSKWKIEKIHQAPAERSR